jgi:hypothetical protein
LATFSYTPSVEEAVTVKVIVSAPPGAMLRMVAITFVVLGTALDGTVYAHGVEDPVHTGMDGFEKFGTFRLSITVNPVIGVFSLF